MDRRNKRRLRLFPKQGYIMLLIGILIGFMVFLAVSSIISQGGGGGAGQEGLPSHISFTFLYTSEKQGWLEEVTPAFEEWFFERFNIEVNVDLVVTGSHDSVNLILQESAQPTAWSPASSIWIPYLNQKWTSLGKGQEIAKDSTPLVLSPVVIAGWSSFFEEHNVTSFQDLYQLAAVGTTFKYGHPDPLLSNGGVMAEVLEFADALDKYPEDFTVDDFTNQDALEFVRLIELNSVMYGKSTGFFGRWAAENGPSAIDCFAVYESVVISNADKATQKWGDSLVAIYPKDGTLLSDHPFVILNAPWVSEYQKFAASQYLFYLLQEQNQDKAQDYGFRPANPNVPLDAEVFNEKNGVEFEIKIPTYRPLSGESMENMFTIWPAVKNPGV
ncbi:MAG TPA: ABC transporter substrate-binding protein [Candidatus Bathyarchaeota archaeon]|nr:ABC transporter substrate-binding protein [Candidatus Bathyarchaeota archaeon]